MVGWIKVPLGTNVGLSPGDFVLDGDPVSLPKKGAESPNFRPMFIVAKRLDGLRCHLVWMQASAQATLCPMGTQLPRGPHPIFSPCLLWPNGWMDQDATWYGSWSRPRPHCVRRGLSSPRERGTAALPLVGPCQLWPWSPISATAESCETWC